MKYIFIKIALNVFVFSTSIYSKIAYNFVNFNRFIVVYVEIETNRHVAS